MGKFAQGGLSIIILLLLGKCVADVPTGEELFDEQQVSAIHRNQTMEDNGEKTWFFRYGLRGTSPAGRFVFSTREEKAKRKFGDGGSKIRQTQPQCSPGAFAVRLSDRIMAVPREGKWGRMETGTRAGKRIYLETT